jgi:hypothetical protein
LWVVVGGTLADGVAPAGSTPNSPVIETDDFG